LPSFGTSWARQRISVRHIGTRRQLALVELVAADEVGIEGRPDLRLPDEMGIDRHEKEQDQPDDSLQYQAARCVPAAGAEEGKQDPGDDDSDAAPDGAEDALNELDDRIEHGHSSLIP
jgi:hypothetical protein